MTSSHKLRKDIHWSYGRSFSNLYSVIIYLVRIVTYLTGNLKYSFIYVCVCVCTSMHLISIKSGNMALNKLPPIF